MSGQLSDEPAQLSTVAGVETLELSPVGVRPTLRSYLVAVAERRDFVRELVRARVAAEHAHTRLGSAWQLLTPLLNAALYFVVFGLLLGASSKIAHYPLFLLTGVLMFTFFSRAVTAASGALHRQRDLVRTLPFPRLLLVAAALGVEVHHLGWSLLVLGAAAVLGVGVQASWLLALAAVLLLAALAAGVGLMLARATVALPDTAGLLPFVLRALAYLSGAYFPLSVASHTMPVLSEVLEWNPIAVLLTLIRAGLVGDPTSPAMWLVACGSALVSLVSGVLMFWGGEPGYGRD